MGRTIFYDICLTALTLVFSVFIRILANGKHYTTGRPPIKIRSVCTYKQNKFFFLLNFDNFSLCLVI